MVDKPIGKREMSWGLHNPGVPSRAGLFGFARRLLGRLRWCLGNSAEGLVEGGFAAVGAKLTRGFDEALALGFVLAWLLVGHGFVPYGQSAGPGYFMSEDLTQAEAEYLLALNKRAVDANASWPFPGEKVSVDLQSLDGSEKFILDVFRGRIKLSKLRLQNRARTTIILARLEIDGAPHRNPDDVELPCPHIHLYREGYGDKWAYPVPPEHFSDLGNRKQTLQDFMRFCNIVEPPTFHEGLLA